MRTCEIETEMNHFLAKDLDEIGHVSWMMRVIKIWSVRIKSWFGAHILPE
jgi:hypothetical protein